MDKEQELFLLRITAQYVAEVQAGQQPNLSNYLARYPRYADAIADFVAYYHAVEEMMPSMDARPLMDTIPSAEAAPSEDAINRVPTSRAINCQDGITLVSSQQEEQAEKVAFVETMTSLLVTATGQRITLSQIAAKLDLSVDIILLLEQRVLAPATIPHALCENIAVFLQQPTALVKQYLYSLDQPKYQFAVKKGKQQMKIAEESVDYSMPDRLNKPSFRAIMEISLQLSAEQRSRWRTILDAERL